MLTVCESLRPPEDPAANLRWRLSAYRAAHDSPEMQDALRALCAADSRFFIDGFVWRMDPRMPEGQQDFPFICWDYQAEAIRDLDLALSDGVSCAIEKSRDMGASWVCILWMLHRWLFRRHQRFLMVSRKADLVDGDEDSLFGHLDFVISRLPRWMLPRIKGKAAWRRIQFKLKNHANGSSIEGESTNKNIARGGRRTAILWDEAAAFEDGDEVDRSTRYATNTRILNSTHLGLNTAFCKLINKAEQNEKDGLLRTMRVIRMHWSRHPAKSRGLYLPGENGPTILDKSFPFPEKYPFSGEKPTSREGVRSPWYDRECAEATGTLAVRQELDIDRTGSVRVFTDPQWRAEYESLYCRKEQHRGNIECLDDRFVFSDHPEGHLRVWCPLGDDHRPPGDRGYIVACDIGSGTGVSDSVAVVLDRVSGAVVAEFAHNRLSVADFARACLGVCRMFRESGGAWPELIWEANGPGGVFKTYIVNRFSYPHVWLRKNEKGIVDGYTEQPGWVPTKESKRQLLIDYREALAGSPAFINPSKESLEELGQYQYEGDDIIHPEANRRKDSETDFGLNHGDRVIAAALALKCLGGIKPVKAPKIETHAPWGSFAQMTRGY